MDNRARRSVDRGPFSADQVPIDAGYELSAGHPIQCLPTGSPEARRTTLGGQVLDTDPAVKAAAIDAGFVPTDDPGTLRAPDVSVGDLPDEPGWIRGAPELAVEYADRGQDEEKLQEKIADLLGAGTRFVWVVRLVGPRRVEVYEPGKPVRLAGPGERLVAHGILKNAVPVEALYDREVAHEHTLRNLLQRRGYADLDAVVLEGRIEEARAALRRVLAKRGLELTPGQAAQIDGCADLARLANWHDAAIAARTAEEALR